MTPQQLLKSYYGYDHFRPGQAEIIQSILQGKDVLAVLPTGGGKSLCYQLPALMLPGITLVLSPLISLMKDQVDSLTQLGIPAGYLNSAMDRSAYQATLLQLRQGQLKILYIAPERLENDWFQQELSRYPISLVAVDEAHCVSQWGHDFRLSYRQIKASLTFLPERPILAAFTATATERVRQDIIDQLGLSQPDVYINSFDRPNIKFTVKEPVDKHLALTGQINHDDAMIIYAQTRKQVDELQGKLHRAGYQVTKYHAGMSHALRQQAQDDFIYERCNLIVATNAFGMGIDKTDVRKVIHYNMPLDIESYYQEAGRAGRDSLPSEAILLFSHADIVSSKYLIEDSLDPGVMERLNTMIRYCQTTSCLRNYILNYFGEETNRPCLNCSACLNEYSTRDVTKEAQMILSCIVRMKQPFGMTMITDVLRGSRNQRVLDWKFDQLPTYGLLSQWSNAEVKQVISQLLAEDYLSVDDHRALHLTAKAGHILFDQQALRIKQVKRQSRQQATTASLSSSVVPADDALFKALRQLRSQLAQEEAVPAYIIFNNKTLVEMTNQLPRNTEALLRIEGIGPVKAEKYGAAFLELISKHLQQNA